MEGVSKSCHHLTTHREVQGGWKGTCQQEDGRVLCNPHLSLALPNVKGQTQKGIPGRQFLRCCPALWGAAGATKWLLFIWSFILQENSCRCSATTTQETDGTLRGTVQSTKHTVSKCALGVVCSSWNCT